MKRVKLELIPSIHRATHQIGLYLEGLDIGVTQGEAHALCHLHEIGTCSIADLHDAFRHKRSTLTSILDRLVEKGFVIRVVHPEDRRSFQISLSPNGKKVAGQVHSYLKELEEEVLKLVNSSEQKGFAAILEAFHTVTGKEAKKP